MAVESLAKLQEYQKGYQNYQQDQAKELKLVPPALKKPILEIQDLSISFVQYTKGLKRKRIKVVTKLNVGVNKGEVTVIVGSSGAGKSLLAHAVLGILPKNALVEGKILYKGLELTPQRQKELRGKEIALIPQSVNSLDPLMKVGPQVQLGVKNQDAKQVQRAVFERYNLRTEVESLYPFQLSGGMLRRVLVATAVVSSDVEVIIADEPTPGLDPAVLQETLAHFRHLADQGKAVLLITHDIETALKIADKIAVFYAGTTVEIAPVRDFCGNGDKLRHPYTKALWRALPQNDFIPIPGTQPHPHELPSGCLFAPRCPVVTGACEQRLPELQEMRGGMVRCFNAS